MDDLISRQAAIAIIYNSSMNCDVLEENWALQNEIRQLPSVQPEIIRCKDCKHKHIENSVWTCPFGLPGGPEFFCGYGAETRGEEHETD